MATLTRKTKPKGRKAAPKVELSIFTNPRMFHEAEAPDRGDFASEREAPESPSRAGRPAEAPDAGEGRAGLLEQEFTHGRSQS